MKEISKGWAQPTAEDIKTLFNNVKERAKAVKEAAIAAEVKNEASAGTFKDPTDILVRTPTEDPF